MDPVFLTIDEVTEIHRHMLVKYGGLGGIRDSSLLRGAVELPKATFEGEFLHEDLCGIAAAYLFYIVMDHPFIDGNKRTGAIAAYVFLRKNGLDLSVSEDDFEQLVLSVATGEKDKEPISSE